MWEFVIPVVLVATLATAVVVLVAARQLPAVRPWAIVTAIAVAAMPLAIVLHNVLSAVFGGDEAVSFVVALTVAPIGITVGTLGAGLAIARAETERFGVGSAVLLAGSGMALFALYTLFALIVSTIEGRNPEYQGVVEAIALPVAVGALALGAALAAAQLVRRRLTPVA